MAWYDPPGTNLFSGGDGGGWQSPNYPMPTYKDLTKDPMWGALVKQYPYLNSLFNQGKQKAVFFANQYDPVGTGAGSFATGVQAAQTAVGTPAAYAGYANLLNMLLSQGKTDPRLMNMQLTGAARDTQAKQAALSQELARRGLSNSGVGMALGGAIGTSGANQAAQIRANEAQLAEQRKRQDLQLLQSLVVGPATDAAAIYTGQYNQAQQRGQTQDAAKAAQNQQYLQMLLGLAGMFF